jgi:hypothetical protein
LVPLESNDARLARLEERMRAAENATRLAFSALETWKAGANEWRQALSDQRAGYPTRSEVVALVMIGLAALGLIMKYIR